MGLDRYYYQIIYNNSEVCSTAQAVLYYTD